MVMLKGISTHLFAAEKLSIKRLESIRDAGFDSIEIFALPPHFDYRNRQEISDLGDWLADQGSFLNSIHTPFYVEDQAHAGRLWLSLADPERMKRQLAVDEIRRCLEFTERIHCPLAVAHMGSPGDAHRLKYLDAVYWSLNLLIPFASSRGVRIVLENIPNTLSSLETMRSFLEEANLKEIGICFDTGHSHLQGNVADEIRAGGPWILTTHLHDNGGKEDDHLLPYEGTIEWPKVLQALEGIGYKGCHLLELKAGGHPPEEVVKRALRTFEQFEATDTSQHTGH